MGFFDSIKGMLGIFPPPTPEELSLLKAVRDQPDDLGPRHSLADYLVGRQDPRGTYMRLELERAGLPEDDPRAKELENEAEELIEKHGRQWVRPFKEFELEPMLIGYYVPGLWFNRGMIEELTIDKRGAVPGKLERLVELAPALRKLVFARCSPDWKGVAGAPLMARIRALDLESAKLSIADLEVLAASPHLAQLEELILDRKEEGDELARVVAASPWTRLKILKLSGCHITPAGFQLLAQSKSLGNLEELDLSYNQLGDAGAGALGASPCLTKLKRLNLSSNEITAAGFAGLAAARFQLDELLLESNRLEAAGVRSIVTLPCCARLVRLGLGWNRAGEEAIVALCQSGRLATVRKLDLTGNEIDNAALAELANSSHVTGLTELDLSANPFTNVSPLIKGTGLVRLRMLKVSSTNLSSQAQAALKSKFGNKVEGLN